MFSPSSSAPDRLPVVFDYAWDEHENGCVMRLLCHLDGYSVSVPYSLRFISQQQLDRWNGGIMEDYFAEQPTSPGWYILVRHFQPLPYYSLEVPVNGLSRLDLRLKAIVEAQLAVLRTPSPMGNAFPACIAQLEDGEVGAFRAACPSSWLGHEVAISQQGAVHSGILARIMGYDEEA